MQATDWPQTSSHGNIRLLMQMYEQQEQDEEQQQQQQQQWSWSPAANCSMDLLQILGLTAFTCLYLLLTLLCDRVPESSMMNLSR